MILRYDKDGDTLEFILTNDNYYAKWISPSLTLYLRQSDNRVVGGLLASIENFELFDILLGPSYFDKKPLPKIGDSHDWE